MHELALAEATLVAAEQCAQNAGFSRVRAVTVRLGELQQISVDTFEFCLAEVRPSVGRLVATAEVTLEIEPARFRCRPCGTEFGLADASMLEGGDAESVHFIPELVHAFVTCPFCRSADFDVTEGRGVRISSIDGEVATAEENTSR